MKMIKTATMMIVTLFALSASAVEWHNLQLSPEVHISYTTTTLVPTYGASGGLVAEVFYVDVRTANPAKVESVTFYNETERYLVDGFPLVEDTSTHFYGKSKGGERTYANFLYLGQYYTLELVIDGHMKWLTFKLP